MRVLAMDTSTQVGGVALIDEERVVGEYVLNVEATHSERLMPAVDRVLGDAGLAGHDVDLVAVAFGPGSFTGLRIGVTTAKTLSYVWKIPVVGVTTLEALAWQAAPVAQWICPTVNARRNTVYTAVYRGQSSSFQERPSLVADPEHLPFSQLVQRLEDYQGSIAFAGDGAFLYEDGSGGDLGDRVVHLQPGNILLRPSSVAFVGRLAFLVEGGDEPFTLKPFYLKKSEAERKWEKQQLS